MERDKDWSCQCGYGNPQEHHYITFGSYKEPIMQPRSLTTPSTISKGPIGTRSYSSVLTNRGPVRTTVRKPQETDPIGGGQMPIAPTVDADSFPELAQRPTTSTVVILDGAPEDPISKPDGTESSSGTDSDAEDTNCVAQLVELGSPTREVPVSILGVDINSFPDDPPDPIATGVPSTPSTIDQIGNEVVEEMDATEVVSVSNPEEDIYFSDGSIQPGQRPLDSQETSHVSETQESLGLPLGTPSTSIEDKTLKAMEAVRRKKPMITKPNPLNPNLNINHD
ncbi:hypothetical protein DAPPUDRAFT_115396 [Daphnia pulex]|uniref:Uncharacterized protein n=1 Tax=Daphnia pulex TaxID=6669 RepID=E9HL78_DAPPU|nr:hypothetical protein DAPPUDRAFT_115396 [Daphnia pulex]|eukprot:EFX67511.1 hypothetical protein DAPPUDRAFT_115396 [Daphnia pulex]